MMSATSGIDVAGTVAWRARARESQRTPPSLANNRSERFLAPRWGANRFGLGTQGGAREAGLPWAAMLRTVGAAPSGPEIVQTPGRGVLTAPRRIRS